MIVFARRASAILFNLLRTRSDPRPFLLPANVCPIVPDTFREARQPFELVDIEEPSLEIEPAECLARLRARPGRYAGLLFIHPYGSERDPAAFFADVKKAAGDILIIDDRCLCRPAFDIASLSADVTLYSTGRAKYADAGGGGFAHLGGDIAYEPATQGADWLELDPPKVDGETYREIVERAARAADEQKARLNAIYERELPPEITLPASLQRWRFNIRVAEPDRLIAAIFAAGLFASRHFPPAGESFAVAARLHAEIVNLFNDRYFDEQSALRISEIVLRHIAR
jgi:hypothetical protein